MICPKCGDRNAYIIGSAASVTETGTTVLSHDFSCPKCGNYFSIRKDRTANYINCGNCIYKWNSYCTNSQECRGPVFDDASQYVGSLPIKTSKSLVTELPDELTINSVKYRKVKNDITV